MNHGQEVYIYISDIPPAVEVLGIYREGRRNSHENFSNLVLNFTKINLKMVTQIPHNITVEVLIQCCIVVSPHLLPEQ